MNTSAPTLIHLDGVTKVFFTDEVETHALAGIHLEIKPGYIAIADRPAAASRRCCRSSPAGFADRG